MGPASSPGNPGTSVTFLAALLVLGPFPQEADRVHVDPSTGEITLAGRNTSLREQSAPSSFDVVTGMAVFRGRLIAAACMDFDETSLYQASAYSADADLLEYAPGRDEWTLLRRERQSMIFNMRVVGDRLLVPEYFPFNERSRYIHVFDGRDWTDMGPLEREAWHIMDVIGIGDTLYASGSWRDADPEARRRDPDWWKGYGHVFMSADGGRTWRDIRRSKDVGRCLDMVAFRERLYCNERGIRLIAWDGRAWEEVPVRLGNPPVDAKLGGGRLDVFADRIVAINADLYYTYDGKAWRSFRPGFIGLWKEGPQLFGLRKDGTVSVTGDAETWTKIAGGVPFEEFDRQAPKGRPLHRGALAMHRGRLWVGTGSKGRFYAAPCEEKGTYTASPERFEPGTALAFSWEAVGAVRMEVRTGESPEGLSKTSWRSAEARVVLPGKHSWAQWRARLEGDGRKTPVLRSVRLARE